MSATEMTITRESGAKTYKVSPAVVVAFEEHFGIALGQMTSMTHLYWLAWRAEFVAEQKAGSVVKQFDDWLEDIVDVEDASVPKATSTRARSRG